MEVQKEMAILRSRGVSIYRFEVFEVSRESLKLLEIEQHLYEDQSKSRS